MFIVLMRTAPRQCVRVYGSSGSLTVCRPFNAYSDIPLKLEADDGDGPRIMRRGPADQSVRAYAQCLRRGPWRGDPDVHSSIECGERHEGNRRPLPLGRKRKLGIGVNA